MDHPRPVGRNCRRQKVGDAAAIVSQSVGPSQSSVPVQSTADNDKDTVSGSDFNMEVLSALGSIKDQLTSLDGRV